MPYSNDCSAISSESIELIRHFGLEAPAKLNAYACAVEDALLEALALQRTLQEQLSTLHTEREQMRTILTDPDQLMAYACGFFGPQGPCPGGAVISRVHTGTTAH